MLLRADAAAPVASLRPHAPPEHLTTARRVASARGPVPAGLGRAPGSAEVSAEARRVRASPQGRDTAAGRGYRPPTPAGPGPPGPRGQRPRCAPGRTDPAAVTGVLAAHAVPPLVIPGPAPADAPVRHLPPTDSQRGGAPEEDPHRGLQPYPAARLCDLALGAGGVAAGHAGTAGAEEPEDHGPLHASDATDLGRRARHRHCPHGRALQLWLHGHAGVSGGLSA